MPTYYVRRPDRNLMCSVQDVLSQDICVSDADITDTVSVMSAFETANIENFRIATGLLGTIVVQ